ncbi:MAG: hypothetical protein JWM63_1664 [Gammaproteobacteria bacterium]|nr:hypothetical protein [Gammaproteobacteria bacterium]
MGPQGRGVIARVAATISFEMISRVRGAEPDQTGDGLALVLVEPISREINAQVSTVGTDHRRGVG